MLLTKFDHRHAFERQHVFITFANLEIILAGEVDVCLQETTEPAATDRSMEYRLS